MARLSGFAHLSLFLAIGMFQGRVCRPVPVQVSPPDRPCRLQYAEECPEKCFDLRAAGGSIRLEYASPLTRQAKASRPLTIAQMN